MSVCLSEGFGGGAHAQAGGGSPERRYDAGVFRRYGGLLHRHGPMPGRGVVPPSRGQGAQVFPTYVPQSACVLETVIVIVTSDRVLLGNGEQWRLRAFASWLTYVVGAFHGKLSGFYTYRDHRLFFVNWSLTGQCPRGGYS